VRSPRPSSAWAAWVNRGVVALACGLPVAWAAWVVVTNPRTLLAGVWDERLLGLLVRTLAYAGLSAAGAVVVALPVAWVIARSKRGGGLWAVLPLPLLLPTMILAYGWRELLHWLKTEPPPQSVGDVARCLAVLVAWLWPVPAVLIGLAWRRIDSALLDQATLDGATLRLYARRAVAPVIASLGACGVLAMQEFSIFEPTGLSVLATEVRMIFETGTLSSAANPIAALVGGAGTPGGADQPQRAALALAAGLPAVALSLVLCAVTLKLTRRQSVEEPVEIESRFASWRIWPLAWGAVAVTVGVPLATMAASLPDFSPARVWNEQQPQFVGSVLHAAMTAVICVGIATLAAVARPRWTLALAVVSFLLGGQFAAIAALRIFSGAWGMWLLDSVHLRIGDVRFALQPVAVMTYVGRFAWVALAAGAGLHAGPWKSLRDMAAVDGATAGQTTWRIVLGVGWPVVAGAGVLCGALALVEVPATALLTPPSIVASLLTWVHQQRYGPMLEASLLLAMIVTTLGWLAIALLSVGRAAASLRRRTINDAE
jgi:ABC-type Fe3+ transport system permease subunit